MGNVIGGFEAQNVIACYAEPNTSGAWHDYNAARNAPAKNPSNYLSSVYFHSDFDYFELAAGPATVAVAHGGLATKTTIVESWTGANGTASMTLNVNGETATQTHVLLNHNLGYIPKYMVAFAGHNLFNGTQVQTDAGGTYERAVGHYATTTQIVLVDWLTAGSASLPAVTLNYEVMVFATPASDPNKGFFKRDAGVTEFARGKIATNKRYLRKVAAAESSFDLDLGLGIDVANGRFKQVSGGVAYVEAGYNGTFAGPAFQPVGGIY